MTTFKQISKVVQSCRKKAGLSQKALADLAGVGKTVIYDIEKGKESVRFNTLKNVLDVLNIKIELIEPIK